MNIKRWLVGILTLCGLFLVSSNFNANASRLPNIFCGHWYALNPYHDEGINDKINLYLHHYSGNYYDTGDNSHIHIYMTHFKPYGHGWYSYKCYTYSKPFKLISKNTLKLTYDIRYNMYFHRVTRAFLINQDKKKTKQYIKSLYSDVADYNKHRHNYSSIYLDRINNRINKDKQNINRVSHYYSRKYRKHLLANINNASRIYQNNNFNDKINQLRSKINNYESKANEYKSNYEHNKHLESESPNSYDRTQLNELTDGEVTPDSAANYDLQQYNNVNDQISNIKDQIKNLEH